jgi:hypothetical protein
MLMSCLSRMGPGHHSKSLLVFGLATHSTSQNGPTGAELLLLLLLLLLAPLPASLPTPASAPSSGCCCSDPRGCAASTLKPNVLCCASMIGKEGTGKSQDFRQCNEGRSP